MQVGLEFFPGLNYPSLKVLEAHIGENMQNTLKIKD